MSWLSKRVSWLRRRLRSSVTPRTVQLEDTVIIWWGFVPWGATIGDYRAVENLSAELSRRGCRHSIVSHPDYGFEGHVPVKNLSTIRRNIRNIVFVCGPLVENDRLSLFLSEQRRARKIAVAVSVLANQKSMNRRFRHILARDGREPSFFDLAIAETREPNKRISNTRPVVGLCLRGKQSDYGKGVAQSENAECILRAALARFDADVIEIDTVIRAGNGVDEIEAAFARIDLMVTTRLHGALFTLAAGKPVVALDQLPGGAKVAAALRRIEWPHVLTVDRASEGDIVERLREMITERPATAIRHSQKRILELGQETLDRAAELITARH